MRASRFARPHIHKRTREKEGIRADLLFFPDNRKTAFLTECSIPVHREKYSARSRATKGARNDSSENRRRSNRFSDSAGFGAAIPAAFNFRRLILILLSTEPTNRHRSYKERPRGDRRDYFQPQDFVYILMN